MNQESITLLSGLGIEGGGHLGKTVKHRSRVAINPRQPNLRQVHLIHSELHDELRSKRYDIFPGQMDENVTTRGIDLLKLPTGTQLHLGKNALIEVTGLRNPCAQLDKFQSGLTSAVLEHDEKGNLSRKEGIMGIVLVGGEVRPGDLIKVVLPDGPYHPLDRV